MNLPPCDHDECPPTHCINEPKTELQKAVETVGNWSPCSKDALDRNIPWASIHKCYEAAKEFTGLKLIHAALRIESEETIEHLRGEVVLLAEQHAKQLEAVTKERDEFKRQNKNLIEHCATANGLIEKKNDQEKLTLILQYLNRAETAEQQFNYLLKEYTDLVQANFGLRQELYTLKSDYKQALEALDNGLQSLRHVVSALHATNSISPDARMAINQMKEALSLPSAIEIMKGDKV
jgi:DNA repair exonuclease SbcCD ATPase subunit